MIDILITYRNGHGLHRHDGAETIRAENCDGGDDSKWFIINRLASGTRRILIPTDIIERIEINDVTSK